MDDRDPAESTRFNAGLAAATTLEDSIDVVDCTLLSLSELDPDRPLAASTVDSDRSFTPVSTSVPLDPDRSVKPSSLFELDRVEEVDNDEVATGREDAIGIADAPGAGVRILKGRASVDLAEPVDDAAFRLFINSCLVGDEDDG